MIGFCDDFEKAEEHTHGKLCDVFGAECYSGFVIGFSDGFSEEIHKRERVEVIVIVIGFSDGFSEEIHKRERVEVIVSAVFGVESCHGGIVSGLSDEIEKKHGEAHVRCGSDSWSYVGVMDDYEVVMGNQEVEKVICDVDENETCNEVVVTDVIDKVCYKKSEK